MNEIINVPMKGQRDLTTVTAEIRAYQDAARQAVLSYCIEIGRRLVEAKSMVGHGEWGDYLREELGFSQSTANNHMRLFEAYGADQMTLAGAAVKSQAFADLSYTQALALLALPSEEEREAFVETHDVGSMSTRELREELKRRGQEEPDAGELAGKLDAAEEDLREQADTIRQLEEKVEAFRTSALTADSTANEYRAEARNAEQAKAEAEKKAEAAAADLARARKELERAQKAEADALAKLRAAEQKPKIPQKTLDKLRKEAEEATEKRHKAGQEDVEQVRTKLAEAEAEAARARQEAERLEKELKLASPGVAVFRDQFARLQRDLGVLINSIDELPEDKQAGARKGLHTILRNYLDLLAEPEEVEK